ncbi:carotenoid oxygenase family protein, partial [Streptomyces xantholiticus]
ARGRPLPCPAAHVPAGTPSAAGFVPAADTAREDAGQLLTVVSDFDADASRLLVLEAGGITLPSTAAVHLPRRVPAVIHRSWIPTPRCDPPTPPRPRR